MMDTMKKYLTLLLLAVVSVATGAGCSSNDKPVQITSLKLNEKDLELTVGESFRLVATTRPADAGATIRWTSSDESVATVDQAGLVTLRAFGTAVITARYRSYSARCTVATLQEPPLDPSAALGAPLSDDIVYSKNVVLYAPRRIMQGFDLTDGGEIYYSQISSDGTSVIVCRAAGPGQDARAEYMTLKYFGHGTQIVAEEASDGKTYIWLNSNASVDSSGEYGDNWSVSRVEFVPGALLEAGYAGETFFLNKDGQYDQQVAIDFPARRLLVGSRKSGVRYFWIFDLDEALALPLKTMTATVTVGSAGSDPVTREIRARDLNDCRVWAVSRCRPGRTRRTTFTPIPTRGTRSPVTTFIFTRGTPSKRVWIPSRRKPMSRYSITAARSSCRVPRWRPSPMPQGSPLQGLPRRGMPRARA